MVCRAFSFVFHTYAIYVLYVHCQKFYLVNLPQRANQRFEFQIFQQLRPKQYKKLQQQQTFNFSSSSLFRGKGLNTVERRVGGVGGGGCKGLNTVERRVGGWWWGGGGV